MKRTVKLFSVGVLAILAGLILKSDWGHGQTATAFEGSQFPITIVRLTLKNQTADIGALNLFTPTSSGLYRVSAYAEITPGSTGFVEVALSWIDEAGAEGPSIFATGSGSGSGSLVVHSLPNQPVTLSTEAGGGFSGSYNLIITVEQL
jgi:hypothetical protein